MDANEKCPWCGNVISHEKFIQIESQIREQEQKKAAEAEAAIRQSLQIEFSQKMEAATKAAARQYEEEAAKLATRTAAEREKMGVQLSQLGAREAEARKQAQEAKESAEATKKNLERQLETERQIARQRGKEEAQKEFAAIEAEHKKFRERFSQLQVSEAEARKLAQQAADSTVALERSFNQRLEAEKLAAEKRTKQETEALLKREMEHQRAILEGEHSADLAKQKSEFQKQNEAVARELQEANRKLEEQKTANQLGDGAEIDLYEALREFQELGDRITRVPKGQPGPDIRHHIVYKGQVCGQIIYDSKNQQQWRDAWVSKLHQDKLDAGAEHAVLAATVFPSGRKELAVESDVIIVNPARAVQIARLLREFTITLHARGLTHKERAGKTNHLYEYINSNEHKQKFGEVVSLNDALQQLDAEEMEAHSKVWKKRGTLLKRQQRSLEEIETEIAAIVEAPALQSPSAALRSLWAGEQGAGLQPGGKEARCGDSN